MPSSSSEAEDTGDEEMPVIYMCRICEEEISPAQREEHRNFHKEERAKEKNKRKSKRTKKKAAADASSVRSSVTQSLFFQKDKKRKSPTAVTRKRNKRRSTANYIRDAAKTMGVSNGGA